MDLVLIGVGGFAGAIARYVVDGFVSNQATSSAFPWGTFVVNVTGSFLLGVLTALVIDRAALPAGLRGPVLIGFIGAYVVAGTSIISLIGWYSQSVLQSTKFASLVSVSLVLLYTFLIVIVHLEVYALIAGSIGLLVVLFLIMSVTRKITYTPAT